MNIAQIGSAVASHVGPNSSAHVATAVDPIWMLLVLNDEYRVISRRIVSHPVSAKLRVSN